MSTTEQNAEQKIIEAAIECIERYGLQHVTTRKIAEAANVNTAAINYYFRTKERVLEEAMSKTIENAFEDWEDFFEVEGADLEEGLLLIISTLLYGAKRYPNISRAHLYKPYMGDFDTPFVRRYNRFLELLLNHIKKQLPDLEDGLTKLKIIQFVSSAIFPAIFPGIFQSFMGTSLTEPEVFTKYSNILKNTLLRELDDA